MRHLHRRPISALSAAAPLQEIAIAVVCFGGRVLIDRRRPGGVMGGLWEFPGGKLAPGESAAACVRREVAEEVGLAVRVIEHLATLDHAYATFSVRLQVFLCESESDEAQALACDAVAWVLPEQLGDYAFPEANAPLIPLVQRRLSCP
ncbi:8-oxo-dGTP diphosphatase MutT [Gloeobacter kilaueensis]|uniref:8-oxo-dGTP diphosphatase MutT n=1 Tax=Gloeobacter kilaueensis TaxID=1416614 RepID=UPI001FDF89AC|nr:8-oxo-dGTP diphosphatase MutT [Gloeobacter kilaueensis]